MPRHRPDYDHARRQQGHADTRDMIREAEAAYYARSAWLATLTRRISESSGGFRFLSRMIDHGALV